MKANKNRFCALIGVIVISLTSCGKHGPAGVTPHGFFEIEWGEDLSQSFQIDGYAASMASISLRGQMPLEDNYAMMHHAYCSEMVVTMDNLFLGFGPAEGSPIHTSADELNENNIPEYRMALANKTKPYLRPIYATDYYGQLFCFASVEGAVTLTADKVLFGRVPGTDLSDCFKVSAIFPPVRVEYPSYDVIDTEQSPVGLSLKEFFHEGIALSQARERDGLYEVTFITKPEETYDDITFTISLPVKTYEYHAYLTKQSDELRASQFTMTGSATVYFGKTVQENLELNGHLPKTGDALWTSSQIYTTPYTD